MTCKGFRPFAAAFFALLGWAAVVSAQDMSAVPGAATATAGPGGTATATASGTGASSGGGNLWSFLCMTPQQAAACKAKLCNCCLVKLLDAGLTPVRAFSGGCLQPCCPQGPSPADLAKPPTSAEGAAARVKQCEMGAPARISAVRYLATAPCQRFPEAEGALLTALRTDCSECVRLEAAKALGSGCCCSKRVIATLLLVVNGGTSDGNPKECSERVRVMAFQALFHCLQIFCESAPATPPEPPSEKPADAKPATARAVPVGDFGEMPAAQVSFYRKVEGVPREELVAAARQTLAYSPTRELVMHQPPAPRSVAAAMAPARTESPAPPLARPRPEPRQIVPVAATTPEPAAAPAPPAGGRGLAGVFRRAAGR